MKKLLSKGNALLMLMIVFMLALTACNNEKATKDSEKEDNKVTNKSNEKEDNYEKISILDLLGDDF